ncbi:nucleolus and neural progenitor protein isoform X1 [Calypte anna]|uniref:nucleolus and neural progenitor protein isoform X1 n=2 Tax=Calypte anna TaxID=9244 RepID=UPI0011C4766F|nr:nucleolus and neural progenitor protein isoform X1 [Calypte anna]
MAAPEAAWNRLDVPWPASSATVALADGHPAVMCLPALRRQCGVAGKRLSGTGLAAEGRVLRAVLYVYHSRLLRHRPYLALKQVEQCTKRLWKMNLVGCIETLAGLIPTKKTSQAHAECLVPSQPVLETVALKVLGGCKLILRLLDCCCKAFLLSVKHLCSEEFILLNTVASGLLSRLWIQYRCVLQSLISLYGPLSTSLHLVSETQQMPYIKEFTFPSDISNFLGVDVSAEVKKQKARMLTTKKRTGWLKNFPTLPEAVSEMGKKRSVAACRNAVKNFNIPCPADIGEPVLVTRASRGKCLGFDVKSLLRPSKPLTQQGIGMTSTPLKVKSASVSSRIASMQDAGSLVQMVQTATSFGELSEALRKVIVWCKGNKFKSAAYFLRNKLLKSNRLHHVEAQGCSLKKKLCCVKTSVRKYLLYGSRNTRWLKRYRGARFCRRRIRSSSRVKRTVKTLQQKPSEFYEVCENSTSLVLSPYQDGPPSWGGRSNAVTASVELSTVRTPKQPLLERSPVPVLKEATENMDIDSIFAAMGV